MAGNRKSYRQRRSESIGIAGLVVAALAGATALGLLAILTMKRRPS